MNRHKQQTIEIPSPLLSIIRSSNRQPIIFFQEVDTLRQMTEQGLLYQKIDDQLHKIELDDFHPYPIDIDNDKIKRGITLRILAPNLSLYENTKGSLEDITFD